VPALSTKTTPTVSKGEEMVYPITWKPIQEGLNSKNARIFSPKKKELLPRKLDSAE